MFVFLKKNQHSKSIWFKESNNITILIIKKMAASFLLVCPQLLLLLSVFFNQMCIIFMFLHHMLILLFLDFSILRYYLLNFYCARWFLHSYTATILNSSCYLPNTDISQSRLNQYFVYFCVIYQDSIRKTHHSWYFKENIRCLQNYWKAMGA